MDVDNRYFHKFRWKFDCRGPFSTISFFWYAYLIEILSDNYLIFSDIAKEKMMQLNDRENLILKTTIEDFIATGVPISSQKLYKHYFHTISPATIRNTLATLEKKGLLKHMHTSSGRLPTDCGYRYYVDTLIPDNKNMIDEYDNVSEKLDGQNLMISWRDGKLIAARSKGQLKNAGKNVLNVKI